MQYLNYERAKNKYLMAQDLCNDILLEKELLFQMTQPKASASDDDRVQSTIKIDNAFDDYLIAKEQRRIDERFAEAMGMLEDAKKLMRDAEGVLRGSNHPYDVIYCMAILSGRKKIKEISEKVGYSEVQVKKILRKIRNYQK